MKLSLYSSLLAALLSFALVNPSPLDGQTTTTPPAPKVKKIPFHGKLLSVDPGAQTITIAGKTPRVFHLTSTTKITDGSGNPSTLSEAVVGEDVGGSYIKESMTLFSVRFGAKTGGKTSPAAATATSTPTPAAVPAPPPIPVPAAETPPPAPSMETSASTAAATAPAAKVKKSRFSGKVVSVDAAAGSLVVHGKADQTFNLDPSAKVVDAGGAESSLSEVTPGTKVSGTYSKSADGATLTVYTLKIGKQAPASQ
ncbi:MAG: hypothetical protein LV480_01100 [Methylacidiphilales bacterium]|nr:hypothetical protein [Candidatus Methylacidiphilales bacterium]